MLSTKLAQTFLFFRKLLLVPLGFARRASQFQAIRATRRIHTNWL